MLKTVPIEVEESEKVNSSKLPLVTKDALTNVLKLIKESDNIILLMNVGMISHHLLYVLNK